MPEAFRTCGAVQCYAAHFGGREEIYQGDAPIVAFAEENIEPLIQQVNIVYGAAKQNLLRYSRELRNSMARACKGESGASAITSTERD